MLLTPRFVIPANAGTQFLFFSWAPASAGVMK
jgi:hypothetical protein